VACRHNLILLQYINSSIFYAKLLSVLPFHHPNINPIGKSFIHAIAYGKYPVAKQFRYSDFGAKG